MHDHDHHHHQSTSYRTLLIALGITFGFAVVEALGGWLANSLALISDAGHMLTDASALGMAALAGWLAHRPPSRRHSYGLGRLELLTALFNALLMIALVVAIAAAAIDRVLDSQPVQGHLVTGVALIGLLVNLLVAWLLTREQQNLNVRGALLHVLGDLLGSVAALISGVVISYTGWTPIDPLLSLLIAALILRSSLHLLREALHSILDGVPFNLNFNQIGKSLAEIEGVVSVHDLHIWSLSADRTALSAHMVLQHLEQWPRILETARQLLLERYDIEHITLQPVEAQELEQTVALPGHSSSSTPNPPRPQ